MLLAKDVATLDALSGGRVELGVGAGRETAAADYALLGIPFEAGGARVSRLARSLDVIDAVLSGRTWPGADGGPGGQSIQPRPIQRPRPPILVAANGPRMLALAGRHADIVALAVGPTETEDGLRERISVVRDAAGDRFDQVELNLNLMAVGDRVPAHLSQRLHLSADALARSGSAAVALGGTAEMCDTLQRRRDALGISYLLVSDELAEAFAPVVERLASR